MPYDGRYDQIFEDAGREWNVDPQLLKAVMLQESNGDPNAVSKAGARGLMQFADDTGKRMGMTDPFDPAQSIFASAKYMDQLLQQYGSPEKALVAYSGGASNYVPNVTANYVKLARTTKPAAAAPATNAPSSQKPGSDLDSLVGPAPNPTPAPSQPATPGSNAPAPAASKPGSDLDSLVGPAPEVQQEPPPAETPPADAAQPTQSEYGDLGPNAWFNTGQPPPSNATAASVGDAVGRVATAATQGFHEGSFQTPEAEAANRQTLLGTYVTDPIVKLGNLPFQVANALAAGTGQAAYEAGHGIGNALQAAGFGRTLGDLGRDFYAGAQTVPIAITGGQWQGLNEAGAYQPFSPRDVRGPLEPPPLGPGSPRTAAEIFGDRPPPPRPTEVPPNTFLPPQPREPPTEVPPSAGPGKPPPEAPAAATAPPSEHSAWVSDTRSRIDDVVRENAAEGGPQSLGAAASPGSLTNMTPRQMKAYRRMGELNEIVSPIEGEDNTAYVPGSVPTEAERMGDPNVSQKEVMTRQRAPDAFEGPNGRLTQNNTARVNAYRDMAGTDVQLEELKTQQEAAAQRDGEQVMAKAGPVDGTKAEALVDGLLADPRIQKNTEAAGVLQKLKSSLYDANGNLETDPRAYWGMHDDLRNMLEKAKDRTRNERFAIGQINTFKQAVDQALSDASGGAFRTFLDNQSQYFQKINGLEVLQDFEPKMLRRDGTIDANRFHRFVTDLAIRRGRPGVDPAMDIPDATMRGLINIDNDLKRAGRIDLGKPRGSATNLFFELARGLGIAGAHTAAAAITGGNPVGNIFVHAGVGAAGRRMAQWRLRKHVRNALGEPPGGFSSPQSDNPLMH